MSDQNEAVVMIAKTPFWNLNLGHILTISAMLVGGSGAYYGMKAELQSVDGRVQRIEANIASLTTLAITSARQDQRLLEIERRMERLEQKPKP